jgi:hypothetical protein
MGTVYINGKPVELTDSELRVYNRYWGGGNPTAPYEPPAFNSTGDDNNSTLNRPASPTLQDYSYNNSGPSEGGELTKKGMQTGISLVTAPVTGPLAALWFAAGDYLNNSLGMNDKWDPSKYRTKSSADRNAQLSKLTGADRAEAYFPAEGINGQGATTQENIDRSELARYLDKVQPYDYMEYYNPKTVAGKNKAYAYTQWAKERIKNRWRDDLDAMDAEELAKKYELALPSNFEKRTPFSFKLDRL